MCCSSATNGEPAGHSSAGRPCSALLQLTTSPVLIHCCCFAGIRDPAAWGFEGGQPPLLSTFAVQLDQRFLTELARTAALFQSLFEASGRKELLKVCSNTSLVAGLLLRRPGRRPSVVTWL